VTFPPKTVPLVIRVGCVKTLTRRHRMKRKRYSEEQIIRVLQEAESGVKTADLCRKYGMSDATFYNWKAKYGGMSVSEAKRLKTLEDENRKLKQIVANLTLDKEALKAVLEKNF